MEHIVDQVETNIIGRIANKIGDRKTDSLETLLHYVELAGDGNYLEIGTLFGGSAISVAKLKDVLGQKGFIFCVDPLNGYYRNVAPRDDMVDTKSGFPVTPETLFTNIQNFSVGNRIFVIQAYSTQLDKLTFDVAVSFIDGDHRGAVPLLDLELVKDVTSHYVIFDNCAETHPDVMKACEIASSDPEWEEVHNRDITYVVKRI